ncbi:hypothetical protein H6G95_08805 [Nostoc linckia FACHB-391]|uniref:Uncharacterized protein n=1 Tax=Nostoc linckia FACHB-391 TaxID=2692906 RepID=A0ABR8ES77_NOSLI|nr:hypothetical protein [Nostoc linckia FACHB-391]
MSRKTAMGYAPPEAIALARKRKAIACPLTNVVRPPTTIEITRFWIQ